MANYKLRKLQQIPTVYDNPLMKEQYLALQEKLAYAKLDISGYGNPENRVWSIEKELKHITTANNFEIFYMGGLLLEAKKILPHGQFGAWIEKKVPFSARTAQKCIKVYERCLGMPELLFSLQRSVLEEVCEKGFPEDLLKRLPGLLNEYGTFKKKDLEKLKKQSTQGKLDVDSKLWQLFILQRQQADYETINIKVIDNLVMVLRNQLVKLSATAPPTDSNKLLSRNQRRHDVIPAVKNAVSDFIGILEELKIDFELGLSTERNEFLTNDIISLRRNIDLCEDGQSLYLQWPEGNEGDDGTLAEAYYEKIVLEELGPEDLIYRDDTDPDDRYCKKVLEQLGRDDISSVDDRIFAEENDPAVVEKLGPEDFLFKDDDERILDELGSEDTLEEDEEKLAEQHEKIILSQLAEEDFVDQSQ